MLFDSYRSDNERRTSRDYRSVLGLLAAVMIFDTLQDTVGTLPALAMTGLALGALSNAGGEAAGSGSTAAAATPAAVTAPRATTQPSLGLNFAPTAPTMGM